MSVAIIREMPSHTAKEVKKSEAQTVNVAKAISQYTTSSIAPFALRSATGVELKAMQIKDGRVDLSRVLLPSSRQTPKMHTVGDWRRESAPHLVGFVTKVSEQGVIVFSSEKSFTLHHEAKSPLYIWMWSSCGKIMDHFTITRSAVLSDTTYIRNPATHHLRPLYSSSRGSMILQRPGQKDVTLTQTPHGFTLQTFSTTRAISRNTLQLLLPHTIIADLMEIIHGYLVEGTLLNILASCNKKSYLLRLNVCRVQSEDLKYIDRVVRHLSQQSLS